MTCSFGEPTLRGSCELAAGTLPSTAINVTNTHEFKTDMATATLDTIRRSMIRTSLTILRFSLDTGEAEGEPAFGDRRLALPGHSSRRTSSVSAASRSTSLRV